MGQNAWVKTTILYDEIEDGLVRVWIYIHETDVKTVNLLISNTVKNIYNWLNEPAGIDPELKDYNYPNYRIVWYPKPSETFEKKMFKELLTDYTTTFDTM